MKPPLLYEIPPSAIMGRATDGTPILKASRCASCKAAMIWTKHPETGNTVPLDAGTKQLVDGVWRAPMHHSTCPAVAHFRRKK